MKASSIAFRRYVVRFVVGSIVVAFLPMTIATEVAAVAIRHDRTDADSLRAGEPFGSVGKVLPDGGCTLIAPTWVLTAAHVAAAIPVGGHVQFGEKKYAVKRTVLHPEGVGPKGAPPEVDLALMELEEPVKGFAPVELYRARDELGKTLFIVGYGDHGDPRTGFQKTDGKRRAVTNVVVDAGPRRIFLTFDEPPKGTELEGVGGPGDSGGPALLKQAGKVFIAGVSSASMNGKPGQYGVTDVYTRVSSFIDWTQKAMRAGRGTP